MKKHPMRFILVFLVFAVASCTITDNEMGPQQIMGYAPVYATPTVYDSISVHPARTTVSAGKIYAFNSFIFQVDQQQGIHIVANGQSASAQKVAFLKIPFCTEVAVKGNFLYANNLNDLVVFDISTPSNPQMVKRIKDAFPAVTQSYPNVSGTFFECVDPSKGIVVGWERKTINSPKCRR
jgi:hypothetical protein